MRRTIGTKGAAPAFVSRYKPKRILSSRIARKRLPGSQGFSTSRTITESRSVGVRLCGSATPRWKCSTSQAMTSIPNGTTPLSRGSCQIRSGYCSERPYLEECAATGSDFAQPALGLERDLEFCWSVGGFAGLGSHNGVPCTPAALASSFSTVITTF